MVDSVTNAVSGSPSCSGDCGDGGGGGSGNAVAWYRVIDGRCDSQEPAERGGEVAVATLFGVGGGTANDGGNEDDFRFMFWRALSSSMSACESGALHRNR